MPRAAAANWPSPCASRCPTRARPPNTARRVRRGARRRQATAACQLTPCAGRPAPTRGRPLSVARGAGVPGSARGARRRQVVESRTTAAHQLAPCAGRHPTGARMLKQAHLPIVAHRARAPGRQGRRPGSPAAGMRCVKDSGSSQSILQRQLCLCLQCMSVLET